MRDNLNGVESTGIYRTYTCKYNEVELETCTEEFDNSLFGCFGS